MPFKPLRAQPVADSLGAGRILSAPLQQVVETTDNLGFQLELLGAGLRARGASEHRSSKENSNEQFGGGRKGQALPSPSCRKPVA